jgi:hypothetical protein
MNFTFLHNVLLDFTLCPNIELIVFVCFIRLIYVPNYMLLTLCCLVKEFQIGYFMHVLILK